MMLHEHNERCRDEQLIRQRIQQLAEIRNLIVFTQSKSDRTAEIAESNLFLLA